MQFACSACENFFRLRIDHLIGLRNPLAVQSSRIPWQELEASVAHLFYRKGRASVAMPDLNLFGLQVVQASKVTQSGRPAYLFGFEKD